MNPAFSFQQDPMAGSMRGLQYSGRSNSVSSFSSHSSEHSQLPTHRGTIPRGSSTSDLMSMDRSFTKRPLKQSMKSHSFVGTNRQHSRLSKSTSVPSIPSLSGFQSQSTNDLLNFNNSHNRKSPVYVPSTRRQSLTTVNQHLKNHFQQPQQPFTPQPPRTHRHKHPNTPFTFPNGEVYLPRTKQRSMTDLKSLNTIQQYPKAPISHHNQSNRPSSTQSSLLPLHTVGRQAPGHLQILVGSSSASNSTSPSPSRHSRSDSCSESTPPSSIDDLSLQAAVPSLSGPLPSASAESNLEKIEERSTVNSIVSPSSEETIDATVTTSSVLEPVMKAQDFAIPQRSSRRPLTSINTRTNTTSTSINKEMSSPGLVSKGTQAKVPQTEKNNMPKTITATSFPEPKRKPSFLKRVFGSMFNRSRSQKKHAHSNKQASTSIETIRTSVKSANTQTLNIHQARGPEPSAQFQPLLEIKLPILSTEPKTTRESVHDTVSDQFSFTEDDEELKIESFNSEEVLQTMFAGLSTRHKLEEKEVDPLPEEPPKAISAGETTDDEEDQVITFDDMEMIEKIVQFGETSFPDLASPDLGQAQRKTTRSKSIERKKSIRSMNSNGSNTSSSDYQFYHHRGKDDFFFIEDEILEVEVGIPREPCSKDTEHYSIMKHTPSSPSRKSVEFTNKIYVNHTYSPQVYDRHSQTTANLRINPKSIHQIRYELNEFKKSMVVHESSVLNTHYFPAQ